MKLLSFAFVLLCFIYFYKKSIKLWSSFIVTSLILKLMVWIVCCYIAQECFVYKQCQNYCDWYVLTSLYYRWNNIKLMERLHVHKTFYFTVSSWVVSSVQEITIPMKIIVNDLCLLRWITPLSNTTIVNARQCTTKTHKIF